MEPVAHILVVDDEMAIRHFLQRTLTRDGHRVIAVESAAAALAAVADCEFDLALIDLRLKESDGLDLLAALREACPATPVIILTAHASLESAVTALRQGAHDYLFKPCPTVDLRESVRGGLAKREQELQRRQLVATARGGHLADLPTPGRPFLQVQGVIVDPARHVVTLDGALLELSPTEFDLVAYLVSESPRVVPAEELIREVQGYLAESWAARDTVRSHMYHIRQKARSATGKGLVRTVRGVGYTLDTST
jgi:DNA-binding response OmpR family regulator